MEIKFKNRYTDEIIDMDTYEKMSIDAQWDYDILQPDSWEYEEDSEYDTNNGISLSGEDQTN